MIFDQIFDVLVARAAVAARAALPRDRADRLCAAFDGALDFGVGNGVANANVHALVNLLLKVVFNASPAAWKNAFASNFHNG